MLLDWLNWLDIHKTASAVVVGLILVAARIAFKKCFDKPPKAAAPPREIEVKKVALSESPQAQVAVGDHNELNQWIQQGPTILLNGEKVEPDYQRHPTPSEINSSWRNRPDYERKSILETFVNLAVDWDLRFFGVNEDYEAEKRHRVCLTDEDDHFYIEYGRRY